LVKEDMWLTVDIGEENDIRITNISSKYKL